MEELTIWEQHTITLNKDPKLGFGFAISGGKDKPQPNGDTSVVVSDVLPQGPAMGRLFTKDQIVMVNGESMENVYSNYTIQTLKSCGKTANITVKRPRKIQIPATTRPTRAASHSNLLDYDPPRRTRRYSDGSDNRDNRSRYRGRSPSPERNGHGNVMPLMSSGYKRLPNNNVADKPIRTTLVKKKITDEYGLKLGSQIFIKHMTETGLAAKEGTLQEGDLILKINGVTTENLSLLETKHLVEKSRGKLTMTVLRDDRRFLVTIPEVEDSPPNSDYDRRKDSSSELEDISDLDEDIIPHRKSRQPAKEKRTHRRRAEPPPSRSRDPSPVRSTLPRNPPKIHTPRRAPSESESDHSVSPPPPPVRRDRGSVDLTEQPNKYKSLSGVSTLPNPRSSPVPHNWNPPRPPLSSSRPRRLVSESDSERSASPPPRRASPPPRRDSPQLDSRYKPLPELHSVPIHVRQDQPRRVNSPVRAPAPDSGSESDSYSERPQRHSTSHSQDSLSRYRALPDVSLHPVVEPSRWSTTNDQPHKGPSESGSEASYPAARRESTGTRNSDTDRNRYRVLPEKHPSDAVKPKPARRAPSPDDSDESDHLAHLRRSGSSEREESHRSAPRAANGIGTGRSGISVRSNPPVKAKPVEEPIYSLPPDSYPTSNPGYSSDLNKVSFVKERSLGLRLVGGNDVGIFVGGVQPHSPAYEHGMKEGDQIMQVNKVDFGHFTREEAANFLLNINTGEQVEIRTQKKMDIYKKIIKSNLGDNFYIRTHFDHEPEGPKGLGFMRGEVFKVVDTMHGGKMGSWLAILMGNDLREMQKGIIPNQARAEKLASIERAQRASGERQSSGQRAEFWKLRGLRGNKKNEKTTRRSRDDLLQLTIQGKFPAYERVLLREANFKRPIVILGPLNDIAMEKLTREMPDEYEIAEMVPRSGGGDGGSTVIKLDTVRRIAEKDKHPLLDITPTAVERLNYIQYHPMVIFLDPHSRKDIKAMRHKYNPDSNKSSRRLYTQALKMRKQCSHLFSSRIDLDPGTHHWYESLKNKIRHQQSKPVWVSEVTLESSGDQDLDALDQTQTDYLSAASDLEDTDGEGFTDEAYTDDEAFPGQDTPKLPRDSRLAGAALARSSEPAYRDQSPTMEPEYSDDVYADREVPPLMHVPEPRSLRRDQYSPPPSPEEEEEEEEEAGHRSFTDSDFSAPDVVDPTTPSDGPPDFRAPDPTSRYSVNKPSYAEEQPEMSQPEMSRPAGMSVIEEKLQQARTYQAESAAAQDEEKKPPQFIVLAHHHEAVQFRRAQIRGSDSSEDEFDHSEDIEWGPATEL